MCATMETKEGFNEAVTDLAARAAQMCDGCAEALLCAMLLDMLERRGIDGTGEYLRGMLADVESLSGGTSVSPRTALALAMMPVDGAVN